MGEFIPLYLFILSPADFWRFRQKSAGSRPLVLVADDSPIHTGKLSQAARAAPAYWGTVAWLPKYARELKGIETVWRDLKAHHIAHQTFADTDALGKAIHRAIKAFQLRAQARSVGRDPDHCLALFKQEPPPTSDDTLPAPVPRRASGLGERHHRAAAERVSSMPPRSWQRRKTSPLHGSRHTARALRLRW